ncbi:MAG: transglycosylase SLT domain-containing protein [Nanoarchaeota archaeon]|nr:transglycosylase SLT domain-containing protein [Nanoarchaeota archaeon]MBU1855108.1 transglycosylase SLT domain-containing protein [Nanoarchaeota archaeon]
MKKINKKGQVFVIIVLIFTTIALYTLVVGMNQKYNTKIKNNVDTTIGTYASIVVKSYQEQEAGLLYLDNAAKIALTNAIIKTAEKGGVYKNNCGTSTYNLWNTETQKCPPEYEETLKQEFNNALGEKLANFKNYQLQSNHFITINQNKEILELKGETNNKVRIAMTGKGEIEQATTITETDKTIISTETIKRIEQYDSIIQQAAHTNQVEDSLIKAIITQESKGEPKAISQFGAAGIMQFINSTGNLYLGPDVKVFPFTCKNNYCEADNTKVYIEDPRFDPEKAIPAGAHLLSNLRNLKAFRDLTQAPIFTIAAYNAGEAPIMLAILKTGKKDPTWEEVEAYITKETLKKIPYYNTPFWTEPWIDKNSQVQPPRIESKPEEIKTYVERVKGYFVAWGGLDLKSPTTIGYFEFGQNFKTQTKYNLSVYEELKLFADKVTIECNDDVSNCLNNQIIEFNKNHNIKLLNIHECEEGSTQVFYDFIENLQDCTQSWGDNCKCQITEDYNEQEIKELKNSYELNFEIKNIDRPIDTLQTALFEVKLIKPEEKTLDFEIEQVSFWNPKTISFKIENEITNQKITFIDQVSNSHEITDFNKIYLVRKDNSFSIWTDSKFSEKLRAPDKTPIEIQYNCSVAKKVFRLCAVTNEELKNVKEENNKKIITTEPTKIKFALSLKDIIPPKEVEQPEITSNKEEITLSWIQKDINDLTLYKIMMTDTTTSTKSLIGEFYKENEEEKTNLKEEEKLYYKEINNEEKKYEITINKIKHKIQEDKEYSFNIIAIDNFQNENIGTNINLNIEPQKI